MRMVFAVVALLASCLAFGFDGELLSIPKTTLRPDLVDSGFCSARVPIEGNYIATVNEIIEIDFSVASAAGCGPDRITVGTDNESVVKYHKKGFFTVDTGVQGVSTSGIYFTAIKRGEATITLTLENPSQPGSLMSFQYHISVQ